MGDHEDDFLPPPDRVGFRRKMINIVKRFSAGQMTMIGGLSAAAIFSGVLLLLVSAVSTYRESCYEAEVEAAAVKVGPKTVQMVLDLLGSSDNIEISKEKYLLYHRSLGWCEGVRCVSQQYEYQLWLMILDFVRIEKNKDASRDAGLNAEDRMRMNFALNILHKYTDLREVNEMKRRKSDSGVDLSWWDVDHALGSLDLALSFAEEFLDKQNTDD